MRWMPVLAVAALVACQGRGEFYQAPPVLEMTITSPTYGEFASDGPVLITGYVNDPAATVIIEKQVVPVQPNGDFAAHLPFNHDYVNIDIEATLVDQVLTERIPVFRGNDPLETWPGGLTFRLTEDALDKLGLALGQQIDDSGWAQSLGDAIPSFESDAFSLRSNGVSHEPTRVVLDGVDGGIDVGVALSSITIDLEADIAGFAVVPIAVGLEKVQLSALAVPEIDAQGGISLQLADATLVMDEPIVELFGLEIGFIEDLLAGVFSLLGGLGDGLLDLVLGQIGTIPLGNGFSFDTDLLGTPMSMRLATVFGDDVGIGAGLAVGLGEPIENGAIELPIPGSGFKGSDLTLALHEGLFQVLLDSEIFALLSQDIELGGVFGNVLGVAITSLPGGHTAPETDGWCVAIDPGEAKVVRLKEGTSPLAAIYFPDFTMDVGYRAVGGSYCQDWLDASLALEIGLDVKNGTELEMDMKVPDGAISFYGAPDGAWTEDEVVGGLGDFLDTIIGFAGSSLGFDLADILGGGLGGLGGDVLGAEGDMRILGSRPMLEAVEIEEEDEDGNTVTVVEDQPIEGLYEISFSLWK